MPWHAPTPLPHLLRPNLKVVFVGFNPGTISAARGQYYANPGNRFYLLLAETGLTPRRVAPEEFRTLPEYGIGLTDLCPWRVGQSDILTPDEISRGRKLLLPRLRRAHPRVIAFNGLTLFKYVFGRMPRPGLQPERVGSSAVFALPSTSGLVNGQWRVRKEAFKSITLYLQH